MKRLLLVVLILFLLLSGILALAWFVPMPLDPFHDFQVLYRANQGILRGIPLYDRAAQAEMVAGDLGVSADQVFVLPFPYPPWFALTTLPLALLPAEVAVRVWFLLNVTMLLASVWLVTDGWHPRLRLISFVVAPLFFPILGALIVGQYVFPTILGMAMLVYALRKQNGLLVALGMALVTFKPHVGMFIVLTVAVHLLLRRDEFGRRAFLYTAINGAILFALGFLADGNWIINYPKSLLEFKGASECRQCVSLPMTIANLAGWGFDQAFVISFVLLIGFSILLVRLFPRMNDSLRVGVFTCVTVLVIPYLQNYDFAFTVIPLFVLAGIAHTKTDWLIVTFIFLLPWMGFGFFGAQGTIALLFSTILLIVALLTNVRKAHTIAATT